MMHGRFLSLELAAAASFLVGSIPTTAALPDGVISMPLHRIKNESAYGLELQVGTPPQRVIGLLDTGSPSYGFESPLNSICAQGLCDDYGIYDNTSSSTSDWISDGFSDMLIDHGGGSFVNDTIKIGGIHLENMYFGVLEEYAASFPITTPQAAIFGMGALCDTAKCVTYPTFLQQLYDKGVISKRAFSVYLGPDDPDAEGLLLIGGIDRAKRQGPVYNHKVADPLDVQYNHQPNFVGVKSLRVDLENGTSSKYNFENDTYALWDTGSPRWYVPQELFASLAPHLGLSPDAPSPEGFINVDCAYRGATEKTAVVADFGEGAEIRVPVSRLVTQLMDGRCATFLMPFGNSFGDAFLRSVYFTFDYDELTVEFAAVNYTTKTDIVKIG